MSSSVYQAGRVFYRLLLFLATKCNTIFSISISILSPSMSSLCITSCLCLCFTFNNCLKLYVSLGAFFSVLISNFKCLFRVGLFLLPLGCLLFRYLLVKH